MVGSWEVWSRTRNAEDGWEDEEGAYVVGSYTPLRMACINVTDRDERTAPRPLQRACPQRSSQTLEDRKLTTDRTADSARRLMTLNSLPHVATPTSSTSAQVAAHSHHGHPLLQAKATTTSPAPAPNHHRRRGNRWSHRRNRVEETGSLCPCACPTSKFRRTVDGRSC